MLANLACGKQQADTETIHTSVVADGGEVLHTFAHQGANQIFWNTAEPKSAHHDACAIKHIADGLVCAGYDFVHKRAILEQIHHAGTLRLRAQGRLGHGGIDSRRWKSKPISHRFNDSIPRVWYRRSSHFLLREALIQLVCALEFHRQLAGAEVFADVSQALLEF